MIGVGVGYADEVSYNVIQERMPGLVSDARLQSHIVTSRTYNEEWNTQTCLRLFTEWQST